MFLLCSKTGVETKNTHESHWNHMFLLCSKTPSVIIFIITVHWNHMFLLCSKTSVFEWSTTFYHW